MAATLLGNGGTRGHIARGRRLDSVIKTRRNGNLTIKIKVASLLLGRKMVIGKRPQSKEWARENEQ